MSKTTVKDELYNIAERQELNVERIDGKFNLSPFIRNLDFEKYTLSHQSEYYAIRATCSLLAGTSDKPSYFSGNTAVQNRFSIVATCKDIDQLPDFSIYESGLWGKYVRKRTINISCKDKIFANWLYERDEVAFLSERINNSAEVSPSINCVSKNDHKELSIFFQSYSIELELLEEMIRLSKALLSSRV